MAKVTISCPEHGMIDSYTVPNGLSEEDRKYLIEAAVAIETAIHWSIMNGECQVPPEVVYEEGGLDRIVGAFTTRGGAVGGRTVEEEWD